MVEISVPVAVFKPRTTCVTDFLRKNTISPSNLSCFEFACWWLGTSPPLRTLSFPHSYSHILSRFVHWDLLREKGSCLFLCCWQSSERSLNLGEGKRSHKAFLSLHIIQLFCRLIWVYSSPLRMLAQPSIDMTQPCLHPLKINKKPQKISI